MTSVGEVGAMTAETARRFERDRMLQDTLIERRAPGMERRKGVAAWLRATLARTPR